MGHLVVKDALFHGPVHFCSGEEGHDARHGVDKRRLVKGEGASTSTAMSRGAGVGMWRRAKMPWDAGPKILIPWRRGELNANVACYRGI